MSFVIIIVLVRLIKTGKAFNLINCKIKRLNKPIYLIITFAILIYIFRTWKNFKRKGIPKSHVCVTISYFVHIIIYIRAKPFFNFLMKFLCLLLNSSICKINGLALSHYASMNLFFVGWSFLHFYLKWNVFF